MMGTRKPLASTGDYQIVFESGRETTQGVTIIIPLYNYQTVICQALDSALQQTFNPLSLIVVDDYSSDQSLQVCKEWLKLNSTRFEQTQLLQHKKNYGLSVTRNTAFIEATTELVFTLDADNQLYPKAIEYCEEALTNSNSAFAYPILEMFGNKVGLMGTDIWSKERLAKGNYIDAMALIRKSCWQEVKGYTIMPLGWEDYDLWCKFAEKDWTGLRVPSILARYRVHSSSMTQTLTNYDQNLCLLIKEMEKLHPWLEIAYLE